MPLILGCRYAAIDVRTSCCPANVITPWWVSRMIHSAVSSTCSTALYLELQAVQLPSQFLLLPCLPCCVAMHKSLIILLTLSSSNHNRVLLTKGPAREFQPQHPSPEPDPPHSWPPGLTHCATARLAVNDQAVDQLVLTEESTPRCCACRRCRKMLPGYAVSHPDPSRWRATPEEMKEGGR